MSFGNVTEMDTNNPLVTYFAAGSMTWTARPATGTANYAGIADGLWIDNGTTRRLYGSPMRLTADFTAGTVTTTLDLRGHGDAFGDFMRSPTTVLGTLTGSGTIGNYGLFGGEFTPAAGYAETFTGAFFGPSAEEVGLAFKLSGGPGQTVFGAAAGKRD